MLLKFWTAENLKCNSILKKNISSLLNGHTVNACYGVVVIVLEVTSFMYHLVFSYALSDFSVIVKLCSAKVWRVPLGNSTCTCFLKFLTPWTCHSGIAFHNKILCFHMFCIVLNSAMIYAECTRSITFLCRTVGFIKNRCLDWLV